MEITGQLANGQPWEDATGEVVLTRSGNSLTAAYYKSGITLSGQVNPRHNEYQMNFQVQVPLTFSGRTRGFLGNLDGNPGNDFYAKGQTNPLPSGISERDLYFQLLTCKLNVHVPRLACFPHQNIVYWRVRYRPDLGYLIDCMNDNSNICYCFRASTC